MEKKVKTDIDVLWLSNFSLYGVDILLLSNDGLSVAMAEFEITFWFWFHEIKWKFGALLVLKAVIGTVYNHRGVITWIWTQF